MEKSSKEKQGVREDGREVEKMVEGTGKRIKGREYKRGEREEYIGKSEEQRQMKERGKGMRKKK